MPYVTDRWLGGMLTNWRTIRQRINELERLERMRDTGDFGRITKKEALILSREIERLEGLLGRRAQDDTRSRYASLWSTCRANSPPFTRPIC